MTTAYYYNSDTPIRRVFGFKIVKEGIVDNDTTEGCNELTKDFQDYVLRYACPKDVLIVIHGNKFIQFVCTC